VLIRTTNAFTPCVVNGTTANGTLRSFGYTREPGGDQYVAVNPTKNTIEIFRSTDDAHTWSASPVRTFGGVAIGSAFLPTLNTDGTDRIALHMFWTDISDTNIAPVFAGARRASMNDWDQATVIGSAFCQQPAPADPLCQQLGLPKRANRTLGDYMEMGAKWRTGEMDLTYLPTWGHYPRNWCPATAETNFVMATRVSID
jgi:hypothetical protein